MSYSCAAHNNVIIERSINGIMQRYIEQMQLNALRVESFLSHN